MRKAALYTQGRIVLGRSHLDAFEQLSDEEKSCSDLMSGFFNEETGEFQGYVDEEHFFHKEILLLRHGTTFGDEFDPDLSEEGCCQVKSACRLLGDIDLSGFVGYCSPMLRCLRTAEIISQSLGINFRVEPDVLETPAFLSPGESFFIPAQQDRFPDYVWPSVNGWVVKFETAKSFLGRTLDVLKQLPNQSMIVSHSGFVMNIARMALCEERILNCGIPTASLTHIENRKIKCLGRNI